MSVSSATVKAGILATDVYDFESSMDIQLTQDKAGPFGLQRKFDDPTPWS